MTDEKLRAALQLMVDCFKPFTMRPMGGPGSAARVEQDQQIAAHKQAREALALSRPHQHSEAK